MNLQDVIQQLDLKVLTAPQDFSAVVPTGGYASDLLSCVMAGAKSGNLWVTLMSHANIVAVAALTEVSAVIITENATPEADVVAKANEQGVALLLTPAASYQVVGRLWELGIR
jgi:hypothetical protein